MVAFGYMGKFVTQQKGKSSSMKKLVIVEPNPDVREMFRQAIEQTTNEKWEAVNVPRFSEARGTVEDHLDARMVLVSLDAPTQRGGQVAQEIKQAHPELTVVLTSSVDGESLASKLGLDGFLPKLDFLSLREKILQLVA